MMNNKIIKLVSDYQDITSPLRRKRNWVNLGLVLNAAVKDEPHVPLTVIGRNNQFGKVQQEPDSTGGVTKQQLPLEQDTTKPEAEFLARMFEFGLQYYGEPVFDYFNVTSDRYEDVDYWRNYVKLGRMTGPGAGLKRVTNLEKLKTDPQSGQWKPVQEHLNKAQARLSAMYSRSITNDGRTNREIPFSTDTSTTNSGEPWYTRKNRVVNNEPVRQLIAKESNSLDYFEASHLPAFLGARAQAGKWEVLNSDSVEGFVSSLVSKDHSERVELIMEKVRFTNFKSRIISAASGINSYQAAPLIGNKTEQQKQLGLLSCKAFLNGPEAIKEWMIKAQQFKSWIKDKYNIHIDFYNADASAYDSTLRDYHAQSVYEAIEPNIPRFKDKTQYAVMLATSLVRPIQYLPEPLTKITENNVKSNVKLITGNHGLGSGEPITNDFGSDNMFLCSYAARRGANNRWEEIYDLALQFGFNPVQVVGDDNILPYEIGKDNTIREDLSKTVELQNSNYGLIFHDANVKGEAGLFFTQFRLTDDGRFLTPISRLKSYWSETTKTALPAYVEVIKWWQNFEYRWDCKGFYEYLSREFFPYDKTKLGMVDRHTGKQISLHQFRRKLKEHEDEYDKTVVEMLFKGNPYDETMLNKDNKKLLSDDWVSLQFNRVKAAYNYYLGKTKKR